MLKKTIKYTDYNNTERVEDFYFNLTKAELMELEMGTVGGLSTMLEKIVASVEVDQIIKIFKEIILKSYGEKSADGRRFIKNDDLTVAFTQTEAYSNLFMELATDSDAAVAFINGIMPSDIMTSVDAKEIKNSLPEQFKTIEGGLLEQSELIEE